MQLKYTSYLIGERKLLDGQLVQRRAPLNLNKDHDWLFRKEYVRDIPSFSISSIENKLIDHDLFILSGGRVHSLSFELNRLERFGVASSLKAFFKYFTYKRVVYKNQQAYIITDHWSGGFFHWMLDVLPKLSFLIKKESNLMVLIPRAVYDLGFVQESLKMMEFTNYVVLERNCIYRFSKLNIIRPIGYTGNYHPVMIESLVDHFTRFLSKEADSYIYVSRRKASRRRVLNEDVLIERLRTLNFRCLVMEDLSLLEQINIVSRARLLISVHGAALSHLLFMKPDTKVLEIRADSDQINNCYFSLASVMSVNYYYCLSKPVKESTSNDLVVDMSNFDTCLNGFLNQR